MGKKKMKIGAKGDAYWFKALCGLLFWVMLALPGFAQTANSESPETKETGKKEKGVKWDVYAETNFEYNDNIYRLTEDQIASLKANAAEDAVGGRFEGMDSISEYVLVPTIGLKVSANSPFGGRFGLTSRIKYNFYTQNREGRHSEGRFKFSNTIGKSDSIALQGNFLSGFYRKNYLSGVNDVNGNGNITREERIYSPAFYNEYEGILEYEHDIIKNKERIVSKADIRPFIGYNYRSYNAKFRNRDQNIPFLGLGFRVEFGTKVNLEMIYLYERVSSPNKEELILIDETIWSKDLNNDGRIKENAPLLTAIDRSCRRHTLEIGPSWELTKHLTIYAGYERRTAGYITSNSFDNEHFNVDAYRQKISAGTKYDISKAWSAEVEYGGTDDDNDEDGNYSQNTWRATLKYKFN